LLWLDDEHRGRHRGKGAASKGLLENHILLCVSPNDELCRIATNRPSHLDITALLDYVISECCTAT
jgi:hypothetical protein